MVYMQIKGGRRQKAESRKVFSWFLQKRTAPVPDGKVSGKVRTPINSAMDDEQQPGCNFYGCLFAKHFVADAACFIRIQCFVMQGPLEISGCNACDFTSPWD
jgi:hypothetical protein